VGDGGAGQIPGLCQAARGMEVMDLHICKKKKQGTLRMIKEGTA
jgi:hypothetical protein